MSSAVRKILVLLLALAAASAFVPMPAAIARAPRTRHPKRGIASSKHLASDPADPDAVTQLREQLEEIHRRYGKPIWFTEIGALDIRAWGEPMLHAPTAARAARYMRRLFPMLDSLPFVQRYAWFTDDGWNDSGCRYGSLLTGNHRLTVAGSAFQSAR
jgi:hypothetical protein